MNRLPIKGDLIKLDVKVGRYSMTNPVFVFIRENPDALWEVKSFNFHEDVMNVKCNAYKFYDINLTPSYYDITIERQEYELPRELFELGKLNGQLF